MLNDATVISYTCIFLPVTGAALFALGWLFVFRNACQGMGKTVLPMVSGIVEVAMRVMVVLLLAPRLAFRGVAFAEIFRMGRSWSYAYDYLLFLSEAALRENSRCERIKGEVIYKNPACTAL